MRRFLMGLSGSWSGRTAWRADDKPAATADPGAKALSRSRKEFVAAQTKFVEQVKASAEAAKKSGSPPKPVAFEDGPGLQFSPRFLALAEKYPDGATRVSGDLHRTSIPAAVPTSKAGIWGKAMTLLKDHYATKPEIKPLLRPLGTANDEAAESLIREVIAKNPDRKLQALACRSLADGRESIAEMVDEIKNDPELRQNFESVRGKPYVAKLLADHDKRRKEADELKKTLREKYADVIADVSIGKPAPRS